LWGGRDDDLIRYRVFCFWVARVELSVELWGGEDVVNSQLSKEKVGARQKQIVESCLRFLVKT
jgi:hypothetical protein